MPDFPNYREKEERSGRLKLGAGIAGLSALLIPGVRRGAARLLFEGAERVGAKWGAGGPSRIAGLAAELRQMEQAGIPNAARQALGLKRSTDVLEEAFGRGMSEGARGRAEQIVRTRVFRGYLGGGRMPARELLLDEKIASVLTEQIQAASAANPGMVLDEIKRRETARLLVAVRRSQRAYPTLTEVGGLGSVQATQQLFRQGAAEHLATHAKITRSGFASRVGRFFGVEPATLASLHGTALAEELKGSREILAGFSNADTARSIGVGGVYHVGGQVRDLRRFENLAKNMHEWVRENTQIPLAPGFGGISPFQLFPWTRGKLARQVTHISAVSRDPVLRGVMGAGDEVGRDLFQVGNRFIESRFNHPVGSQAARVVNLDADLRSGLWGYTKRRSRSVLAAQEARRSGRAPGLRAWLGGRLDPEEGIGALASRVTKFKKGSDWAPRLFRRILDEDVSSRELRQAAHFLTDQRFGSSLASALKERGQGLFSADLSHLVGQLDDNDAVVRFFERAASDPEFKAGGKLHSMVGQYRNSPMSVLGRIERGSEREFLGFNPLGRERDLKGIDRMREAIYDEVEERIVQTTGSERGFIDWVQSKNLGKAERERALAYGHGKAMLRRLDTEGAVPAADWIRNQGEAQEAVERYVKKRSPFYEEWGHNDDPELQTAALVSQHAQSPRAMLTAFNRARRHGASVPQSLGSAANSRFTRQFSAFFTGNQKDTTNATMALEYFPRRLEGLFRAAGLGLPDQDLLSGGSIFGNLLLKRILPAVLGVEAYRYADYQGERHFGSGLSDGYANVRGHVGLARARLSGTHLFGARRELFPGMERVLPTRSEEEERQHQAHGFEPVRKGRFWSMGSRTEFWGEKIDYFAPSAVRTARSHWQGATNVDLNSREYWANSWLPLPENRFLGPFKKILNPGSNYWWEEKHKEDRPYVVTGEMFDPQTVHGPLFNATIGRFLKPQKVLHPESLPANLGGTASQEEMRKINRTLKSGADLSGLSGIVGRRQSGPTPGKANSGSASQLFSPGVLGGGRFSGSLAEITPGGELKPMALPSDLTPGEFGSLGRSSRQSTGHGARLSRKEIERINRLTRAGAGGLTPLRPASAARAALQTTPFREEDLDLVDFQSGTIAGSRNLQDVLGLYGYMTETLHPTEHQGPVVATPQRAYGFARRFWDLNIGGLGGDLSEVGRRFLTRPERYETWNPVPNRMPSWLPGGDYMVDFRHGDPYVQIPRGEIRLPGDAYERLNPELKLMEMRASSLGKSVPEMMQQMLHLDTPMSAYGEEVTELGDKLHHAIQMTWKKMGILAAAETKIYNPELGISGHFDAVLNTDTGLQVAEIKTVGAKRFQEARRQPFAEHQSQLNFYLHETRIRSGRLIYVNRDDPNQVTIHRVGYDPREFARTVEKVQTARHGLHQLIDSGAISKGDLYDPVSRFEILSDVAPYSEQYSGLREYLTEQNKAGDLEIRENDRFQAAKRRVAASKKRVTTTPYRFRGGDLVSEWVTVHQVLDPNTFTVVGSENPIRLAGVRSSQERIEAVLGNGGGGESLAERQFAHFGIRPGARVRVLREGDPEKRIADDVLKTQHAVVFGRGGNVNRQLLEMGIGSEKEGDYSDTGVAARFSGWEQFVGRTWETLAHADTPLNTKFMKVRSPLEELERGIVFGKNSGGWQHPFRDYVFPTIESAVSKNPLIAGAALGTFAQYFFSSTLAKKYAFGAGAAVGAGLSALRLIQEGATGKVWKPVRTRKREEGEEYWDTLKYLKFRAMAEHEATLAKSREGVDIAKMEGEIKEAGDKRKRRQNALQKSKRRLKRGDQDFSADIDSLNARYRTLIKEKKKANRERIAQVGEKLTRLRQIRGGGVEAAGARKAEIKNIQEQLNRMEGPQGMVKLGPHATRALQFRELYRSTLYGIEPGETPFLNLFRAFPKYKRELIQGWIDKSGEKERERIFRLLPRAEQRVLGGYLGIDQAKIPVRPELAEYFKRHPLPGSDWAGWRPDVDLESLRLLSIKGEGLDPLESALYPVQIEDAEKQYGNLPIPTTNGTSPDIQARIHEILAGKGLTHLTVHVDSSPHEGESDELDVQFDVKEKREQAIMDALQLGR